MQDGSDRESGGGGVGNRKIWHGDGQKISCVFGCGWKIVFWGI